MALVYVVLPCTSKSFSDVGWRRLSVGCVVVDDLCCPWRRSPPSPFLAVSTLRAYCFWRCSPPKFCLLHCVFLAILPRYPTYGSMSTPVCEVYMYHKEFLAYPYSFLFLWLFFQHAKLVLRADIKVFLSVPLISLRTYFLFFFEIAFILFDFFFFSFQSVCSCVSHCSPDLFRPPIVVCYII